MTRSPGARHDGGARPLRVAAATLVTALLAGLVALATALPAGAHDVLESSDPANGSSVAASPARITLTFDAPVQAGFNTLTVVGPGDTRWEAGAPEVTGERVSVGVNRLGPAGTYQIGYRIVSGDGHPVSGSVSFTLTADQGGTPNGAAPAAPAAPTASPAAPAAAAPPADPHAGHTQPSPAASATSQDQGGGGVPAWPFVVLAVVVVAGALVFALRRRA